MHFTKSLSPDRWPRAHLARSVSHCLYKTFSTSCSLLWGKHLNLKVALSSNFLTLRLQSPLSGTFLARAVKAIVIPFTREALELGVLPLKSVIYNLRPWGL